MENESERKHCLDDSSTLLISDSDLYLVLTAIPNDLCLEECMLTSRVSDYPTVSNGKTRIPGVNDGEEFEATDVSRDRQEPLWVFNFGSDCTFAHTSCGVH